MPTLDDLDPLLPDDVRVVANRSTPIPSIAQRAAEIAAQHPEFVRADIGQISGLSPDDEVLYGPPVGLPLLRSVLAELWSRCFELEPPLAAANVAVCTGASEGLSLLLRCFGRDRVVGIPRGFWENYANSVELGGGRAILLDYFADDGSLDLPGLRRQLESLGVSLLITNFPSNPTGSVLDESEARELCRLFAELDCLVISDEVYARLRFDGGPPLTLLRYAPERCVVVSSASKEYLLPGARVGYVLSAQPDLTDRVLRKLIRANTASPSVLGQLRLLPLLQTELEERRAGREPAFLGRVREELDRRRRGLLEILERHEIPLAGRAGHQPVGTIFLMTQVPKWFDGDAESFATRALEEHVCSVVPGDSFGLPDTLRYSFGGLTPESLQNLDRGLARLRATQR